jgi:hypothetical protein
VGDQAVQDWGWVNNPKIIDMKRFYILMIAQLVANLSIINLLKPAMFLLPERLLKVVITVSRLFYQSEEYQKN